MKWQYHDGGRAEAGFKGKTNDCVTRAIAIATGKPYKEVYDELSKDRSARMGVYKTTYRKYLIRLGYTWTPTMFVGQGCKVHLKSEELPKNGTLIVSVSKHLTVVIDGVLYDTHDCSRSGTRCVYGYYSP